MRWLRNHFPNLIVFTISALTGYSQILFKDEIPYSDSTEIQNLYRQSLLVQDSFFRSGIRTQSMEILETDTGKYLVIDGRLNLYWWSDVDWVNISKSKYHGYNHLSKKFIFNNSIYSFGGYGFWREHGDLIKYDWDRNEWETVTLLTDEDIGNSAAFKVGNYLYVVNPISRNQHINLSNKHEGLYRINLLTREVDVFSIDSKLSLLKSGMRLETQNYYLPSRDPFQIIDKRNMKYKLADITHVLDLSKQNDRSLLWIHGDSLSIQSVDSIAGFIHLDFDSIYKNAPFPEYSILKSNKSSLFAGILIVGILICFIIYKKNGRSKKVTPKFTNPTIDKVLVHSGKTLTQDELDVVFGIDQINPAETQRSKRSNAFKEINHEYSKLYGLDLITRIENPEDKRKYLYQIK
ncbi:MAG: hypothetical protein IPG12_04935 [Saprospiraceae bacterium]|nr:hypothetical protein [Saprospiraceae bacterium]